MRTRSVSNRIDLPTGWSGTTGGAPGKALEIFVLSGDLSLADVELVQGGYAFIPPGSLGFNLVSDGGAQILWFLSDFDSDATIQSPLILDSSLVEWQATDRFGIFTKDLRVDPGSGERTWLTRYEVDAELPWQSSSKQLEGYLMSGQFMDSECVEGLPYTDLYLPGWLFPPTTGSGTRWAGSGCARQSLFGSCAREVAATTNFNAVCGVTEAEE